MSDQELAVKALNLLGELWVRFEPDDSTLMIDALTYDAAEELLRQHPCEACRETWFATANACVRHRRDVDRWWGRYLNLLEKKLRADVERDMDAKARSDRTED